MYKLKVYYYPPASKEGYSNPYSINYKYALENYFEVLDKKNKSSFALGVSFLINTFRADVYIVNWLESISFLSYGNLQTFLVRLGLLIIRLRKKRIVWMYHNIHPHQGENLSSKRIQDFLFNYSDLIISHSQEAAKYARKKTSTPVLYVCHPIKLFDIKPMNIAVSSDILIWGSILPYKGVCEFLYEYKKRNIDLKVHIIGKCNDPVLITSIQKLCGKNVLFENRRASFEELAGLMSSTKYVLFPYIGDCVSSSGALIDTIALGGYPIGPSKGAFKDLSNEGICGIYKNYDDLFNILKKSSNINKEKIKDFMVKNSWDAFAEFLYKKLTENNG